jgi:hypothetical protein
MSFIRRLMALKTRNVPRQTRRGRDWRPLLECLEDRWLPSSVLTALAVSPPSGNPGSVVQIFGTGFVTGTQVFFRNAQASFSGTQSDTLLNVVVPALSMGSADVKVVTPDGQQALQPNAFFVLTGSSTPPPTTPGAPTITNVSPGSGPAVGGTQVTITGTGFETGVQFFFGSVPAAVTGTPTATSATVVSPALTPGTYDVTVLNPDSLKATATGAFQATATTLINQAPNQAHVLSISSAEHADDFVLTAPSSIAAVSFWAVATTPGGAAEPVGGFLGNFSGTVAWAIHANASGLPGAIVSSGSTIGIVPVATGTVLGGTLHEYKVSFNFASPVNLAAGTYWLELHEGPTLTTNTTKNGADFAWETGIGDKLSPSPLAEATLGPGPWALKTEQLAFQLFNAPVPVTPPAAAPTITNVSPAAGSPISGTQITIIGTGFQKGITLLVGGVPGLVIQNNDTTIIALVPGLPVGPADVTLINPDGGKVVALGAFLVAKVIASQAPGEMFLYPISSAEAADDFTLTAPMLISAVQFWAGATKSGASEPPNGFLGTFSGTMSWAIRADTAGLAGPILFSGSTSNIIPVQTPGRLFGSVREYTVSFNLATPVNLAPGTYWLELHEGPTLTTDTTKGGADINWEAAVPNSSAPLSQAPLGGRFTAGLDQLAFQLLGGPSPTAPPPVITGVSPNGGPAVGGTTVQISGTGFQAGSQVLIGGLAANIVGTPTATLLTVTAPALPVGPADVTVLNPDKQKFVAAGAYNAGAAPAVSGLVAYYSFEGNPNDVSGHGNNGTLSPNPPTATSSGFQGGAYAFAAANNNFITTQLDTSPTAMPQVTMGGWFNPSNANAVIRGLLSDDDGGLDRTLDIDTRNGGVRWSAFTGTGIVSGATVVPNQWTFVAVRYDQTTGAMSLDVNGTITNGSTNFGATAVKGLVIGRNPNFDSPFDGLIDNVFVFNQYLTDAQLASIQAGTAGLFLPGPAAPTFTSVTPNSGFTTGGAQIQISGNGFQAGVKVSVGGVAATITGTPTATTITAITPVLPAGAADITILNPDGQKVIATAAFTVAAPPPLPTVPLKLFAVVSNAAAPGTTVQLFGQGFFTQGTVLVNGNPVVAQKVFIGGVFATQTGTETSTVWSVTVPNLPVGPPVDVTILTFDGQKAVLPASLFILSS